MGVDRRNRPTVNRGTTVGRFFRLYRKNRPTARRALTLGRFLRPDGPNAPTSKTNPTHRPASVRTLDPAPH